MILLPVLLLAAASPRVELVDQIYTVPHADWRYIKVSLKQLPVTISCEFRVLSNHSDVQVAVLRWQDLQHFRNGRRHTIAASTETGGKGAVRHLVRTPDDYAVVVHNRSQGSGQARIHLRIALNFADVRYLSRSRQLTVILISFTVFFAVVTFSARKLLSGMRK
jgi:hypothetical protein